MKFQDILEGRGKNYILLCKDKGDYKIHTQTDKGTEMLKEFYKLNLEVALKNGWTKEQFINWISK